MFDLSDIHTGIKEVFLRSLFAMEYHDTLCLVWRVSH